MTRIKIILVLLGLAILAIMLGIFLMGKSSTQATSYPPQSNNNQNSGSSNVKFSGDSASSAGAVGQNNSSADFKSPLDQPKLRITKKPFGIFIAPATSPIQPERFRGYHVGTDFEIFSSELNQDVAVKAVCGGALIYRGYVSGYGGVAIQSCQLNSQPITVLYGHLRLSSVNLSLGDKVAVGDFIGYLGANKSQETNFERKHLHLGIHRGSQIILAGYVQSQSELSSWIDPCLLVCSQ